MITYEQAYQVLGLRSTATQAEIRTAFREKAKQLHPDKNNSPDAHQQFLALHEAYALLTGKLKTSFAALIKEQQEERMRRARESAANYAKMKYKEYLKEVEMYRTSPYAWIFRILYYGLFFIYLITAMVSAAVPIALIGYGIKWFFISCPLWVLSVFIFSYAYSWKKEIDPLFE